MKTPNRINRPRKESNNMMLRCLTDIWTDVQFGVVSWEKLSTNAYSRRYRVSKFKKGLIEDIIKSPETPTLADAVELYAVIRDPNRERPRRHHRKHDDVLPIETDNENVAMPDPTMEPTIFTPVYGTEYDPNEVAFGNGEPRDTARRFRELTTQMADTYERKNADYGNSFSKSIAEFGPVAGVVRIGDKFNRIKNLVRNPDAQCVDDESIGDTLLDMANYCVMLKIEMENKLFI